MAFNPASIDADIRAVAEKRDRTIIDQERIISAAQEAIGAAWKNYAAQLENFLTAAKATVTDAQAAADKKPLDEPGQPA